jgi:hypothetical protein
VAVQLSAPYAFEVFDGTRKISEAARQHELSQPVGKALRLVATNVFLDQIVRVESVDDGRFEYSPPGLGRIDVRAAREQCKIIVGKRDLGFPPLAVMDIVSGNHTVSLDCPDGQNPVQQITVLPGSRRLVTFTK